MSRVTHGMTETPTWNSWSSMRVRCNNPKATGYKNYGGRGIAVCERWGTFVNFLADMGERPVGTTLDRWPDKNGNYEPGNCRWATSKQQRNNMRTTVMLTAFGETKPASVWAEEVGMRRNTVIGRVNRGTDAEDALTDKTRLLAQPSRRGELIHALGRSLTVTQWASEMGLSRSTIAKRLDNGWAPERAVATPRTHASKLTLEQVAEIRASTDRRSVLAARFNLCVVHVRAIQLGLKWSKQ